MSSKVYCSHCDGDVGVGIKDSICFDYCKQWYHSCYYDYIDPYINPKENPPFCRQDSLICSQVHETYTDAP